VIVFFDIGSTLITGPPNGPASRLAHRLRLSDTIKGSLRRYLLTQQITSPPELIDYLVTHCGVERMEAAAAATDVWRSQEVEAVALPGAVAAFRAIRTAGFRAGLISNIWHPYQRGAWRVLPSMFSGPLEALPRVFSYQVGIMKPDTRIYQHALDTAGEPPCNAVMIGDSYENDIAPALSLGMKTVWLLHRPMEESNEIRSVLDGMLPIADHLCRSIDEVGPGILTEILQRRGSSARRESAQLRQLRELQAGFHAEGARRENSLS
jgi:HAD superfamily hydrolase (TIGR01549 family)